MNGNFYAKAFWVLVAFILGNGVSFVVFGLHTVSRADFDRADQARSQQLTTVETKVDALNSKFENVYGQLSVQHLVTGTP